MHMHSTVLSTTKMMMIMMKAGERVRAKEASE
jgi:hypothetical protein